MPTLDVGSEYILYAEARVPSKTIHDCRRGSYDVAQYYG